MDRSVRNHPTFCYAAAVVLSTLALIFMLVSFAAPRIGYPLVFAFTMFGVLAYSWPAWDLPEKRARLVLANVGAFVTQVAVLFVSMAHVTA